MAKRLAKAEEASLEELKKDIKWCEDSVRSLQALLPKEAARDRLKSEEVPALEKRLADEESKLEEASRSAETVRCSYSTIVII